MFLKKSELKTRANADIIDAITRNDDTIVDMIISESISLMKGYLSARFDTEAIFSEQAPADPPPPDPEADPEVDPPVDPEPEPEPEPVSEETPDNRDPVVLKILKDLVIYEIYSLHNPNIVAQAVTNNMERAMEWLRGVQSLRINPDLPKRPEPDTIHYIIHGSNPQRTQHY